MTKLNVIPGGRDAAARFETLVKPHYDALYRVAFRFTGSQHDAEDLVQELCVRAFRELDRLAELDNPRAWLLCVMRRIFIDETRRYARSHVMPLDSLAERDFAHGDRGPAEEANVSLVNRHLEQALGKLDRSSASLIVLHDVEGYSLAELGQMTGIKQGTLKSRLHRARVKLGRLVRLWEDVAEIDLGQGAH